VSEKFDDIARDYIDFVNRQIGVYMDAMAGFEGIKVKIERQVHRVTRPTGMKFDEAGNKVVVWSSYEDPSQPDIIHSRIIRANDYIAANSLGGTNQQQHSQAILVFVVAYWEHSIRPRLAGAKGVAKTQIQSNVMGDLTIARNAILHSKAIIKSQEHRRMRTLSDIFKDGQEIAVSYDDMHKIFYMIKQDIARLLFDWLGVKDGLINPDQVRDVAIQRIHR
jgi:hypothetical protein